jgi:hypothetical protein
MLTAYRHRIAWITLAALLLQVLAMSVHHVAHGKTAAPSGAMHDSSMHHHALDPSKTSTSEDGSSPCAFWLTLHSVARYVPPFVVAASVRPASPNVFVRYDAPVLSPQYLLTDRSSRGPPRFA